MDWEPFLEAEMRGILPADKAALLSEARNRGLAPGPLGGAPQAQPQPEPQGFGQRVAQGARNFFIGDDDPNNLTSGERVAELLNAGGEALTFGLVGDEAAAGMDAALGRGTYSDRLAHRRGQEDLAREEMPVAYPAAQIAGGVTGALVPGVGLAGTASRGVGAAGAIGRGMLAGAGMGGTYGFMEGEGGLGERANEGVQGATLGAAVGGATAGLGRAIQGALDRRAGGRAIAQAARNAPSTEEMRAAARAGYQQVDEAGVQIRPERFAEFMGATRQNLLDEGLDNLPVTTSQSLTPRSARVMDIGDDMVAQMNRATAEGANPGLPLQSVDRFRQHAGTAAAQVNPDAARDARLGAITINSIDDFVGGLGPDDVLAGDLRTAQDLLPRVREMYARMSRSQLVDDAIENSEQYLSGAASGIRNQFRRIVNSDKLSRGFSDAELRVMRRVAQGTIPERLIYNLGSGMGQIATTAGAGLLGGLGGGLGVAGGLAAGGAASAVTNRLAESIARRNAELARAVIANGRLPAQLPVASEATRRLADAILMRSGATVPQ